MTRRSVLHLIPFVIASIGIIFILYSVLSDSPIIPKNLAHINNPSATSPLPPTQDERTDLIIYAYHESSTSSRNLAFFVRHALHSSADFIFVMHSDYDVILPRTMENVRIVRPKKPCFGLGAYTSLFADDEEEEEAYMEEPSTYVNQQRQHKTRPRNLRSYKRYILLDSSARGPFFPSWAMDRCWSDVYFSKLSKKTKAVGMSYRCGETKFLEPALLATDRPGLEILAGSMKCAESEEDVPSESDRSIAKNMRAAGYDVFAMNAAFEARSGGSGSGAYEERCSGVDPLQSDGEEGITAHPYETMFTKTDPSGYIEHDVNAIEILTEWADLANYTSYDACKRRAAVIE